MGNTPETERPLIEPVYSQDEPSATIDLGSVAVEFAHAGKTYAEQGRVSMRFTPHERLLFVVPGEGKDPRFGLRIRLDDKWDGKLRLIDRNVTLDVMCTGNGGDYGALAFRPKSSVVTVTPPSESLARSLFHLFNFPDFFGRDDYWITTDRGNKERCGRVILKADGWNITIAATDKTDDQCKGLRARGGFIITHMGRVERDDRSLFSSEQLQDLLSCMHHFLSFALGRWAGVALPIGFDQRGERVFEQWGMPMVASGRWNGGLSWFDDTHSELLGEVFPGFLELWNDETWKPAIQGALYWYLAANERGTGIGVDTGLILAQTALEQLAWTYCVQHRKMVSVDAFEPRGLSAADRLRLLTTTLDIPSGIPVHLSALHGKRGTKWCDALEAITAIRNLVVHPRKNKKQLPEGSYYEAWKLSLWHLDMVLLRLCGHEGCYANRLTKGRVGVVERVPWAPA